MVPIVIKGYYKDTKQEFIADAVIGSWDGVMDDDYVLYCFASNDEIIGNHKDFCVLSYYAV